MIFACCSGYRCGKKEECQRFQEHKRFMKTKKSTKGKSYVNSNLCVRHRHNNFVPNEVYGEKNEK
jgi:hypothetical protein